MSIVRPKVAVAGAGITGLAAAFYLQEFMKKQNKTVEITLIDAHSQPGGKVQTLRQSGFVIERGPDSFLARKPGMVKLASELGIEGELAGLNPAAGSASILHDGVFHPIPKGFVLGVPTMLEPLFETRLLSPEGKLRALADLVLPGKTDSEDESLGVFLKRRLGEEIVTKVAEPLLSGIYAGDLYRLSTEATFPQFKAVEKKHRSLILGMRQASQTAKNGQGTRGTAPPIPEHLAYSTFLTFRNGLQTMVEALEQRLSHQQWKLGTKMTSIKQRNDERGGLTLELDDHSSIDADAVILAVPPYEAAQLLSDKAASSPLLSAASEQLCSIAHASVANVVLGYHKKPEAKWHGTGFLVPRSEQFMMTACTFTSDKWTHTAPAGSALLRCYVGRAGDERWQSLSDEEITAQVLSELRNVIGLEAVPDFSFVTRWMHAMPQYPPGHLGLIRDVRAALEKEVSGVFITGAGYGGVGLPDCVRQGEETASSALEYLKNVIN